MSKRAKLTINGVACDAELGSTILEAAEAAGIAMPHDCRNGLCEACRVERLSGAITDPAPIASNSVLACTARIEGDAAVRFDPAPREMRTAGVVTAMRDLSREIVEVRIAVSKPVPYLPGQYVKVSFAGLPARDLCPTLTLDGLRELDEVILHIRRNEDGAIGSALGRRITPGCKVKLSGPFGQSFLRRGEEIGNQGRIILISSAAGFAPIWSIAVAARLGQPERPLVLIVSARDPRNLYMRPALEWLAQHDVAEIILTASGAHPMPPARHGRAVDYLPALVASDTVHVAGDRAMCLAIQRVAARAKATCHAIPFIAAQEPASEGIGNRIARLLRPSSPTRRSAAARSA